MKIEFVLEKSQNKFVFWSNTEDISFFKKVIHTTFKQIRQSIEYQLKKIKRPQSQSIYDKFLKVHFLDGMEITKVTKREGLQDVDFLKTEVELEITLPLRKSGREAKVLFTNGVDCTTYYKIA